MIPTRLDSSAEPSQQLCRLQSAGLLSLAATPHYRTTTHSLVVRLYTLQLYNYIPFSCTTINLLLYKYKLIDSTIVVLQLKHFPKNPCIFQKKSVSLQKKDYLQMRVGSNRCPHLKFMAHVPLFLSAKICESRVLTKNFQIYYTRKVCLPAARIQQGG